MSRSTSQWTPFAAAVLVGMSLSFFTIGGLRNGELQWNSERSAVCEGDDGQSEVHIRINNNWLSWARCKPL